MEEVCLNNSLFGDFFLTSKMNLKISLNNIFLEVYFKKSFASGKCEELFFVFMIKIWLMY